MRLHHFLSLVLLGCSTLAADTTTNLQVSIRQEVLTGVSAGIHAFSQIELLNMDDTEPITIESVTLTPEKTYFRGELVQEPIPQQLHVSRLATMTLDAQNVAIVPLTFLPRYPHDENDMPKPSNFVDGGDSAPQLNSYQRADLAHLVGEETLAGRPYYSDGRRNNLDYQKDDDDDEAEYEAEYEVSTSVVVETNRGTVFLKVVASSIRSNKYRVPERIRFHPPPAKTKSKSSGTLLLLSSDRGAKPSQTHELPSFDCYDLHLFNPNDEPLVVIEAMASKPDSISLFNADQDSYLQNASKTITDWGGEKVIQPGETVYAVTVCPVGTSPLEWMAKPSSKEEPWHADAKHDLNMGYVQIKTDRDTLFVLLEWYLTMQHFEQEAAKPSRTPAPARRRPDDRLKLRSKPSKLKVNVVPYVSPETKAKFSIQNPSTVPLKVMRASLVLDKTKSVIVRGTKMNIKMKVGFHPSCDPVAEIDLDEGTESHQCRESGVIGGGSTWKDAISIEASLFSNMTMEYLRSDDDPLTEVTGRVVVTATTNIASTYAEWYDAVEQNPHSREKVVLEIPWSIQIVEGTMHAIMEQSSAPNLHLRHEVLSSVGAEEITAMFFPFEPLDLRDWTYWQGVLGRMYDYDREDITNTVRIVAFSQAPLNITKLKIVKDKKDPNSKVCDRFGITLLEPETLTCVRGIRDLGAIVVSYDFDTHEDDFRRREGNSAIQDVIYPTICELTFETGPVYTGEHVIDLVVFTGKLEVASTDPGVHVRSNGVSEVSFNSRARDHLIPATVTLGFKEALAWFESSVTGTSLLEYLRGFSKFGKWTPSATLFREYLYGLGDVTEDGVVDREGFVEPIMMHAGAVAHGETITMPLYFTNHNPVPVQVFIDASEVEGMSVSIAREAAMLRGDGNSIVDYLPHKIGRRFDRIPEGPWAGHSREGLKSFLVNSDFATAFYHFTPHRDVVEVSQRATKRLPLLRSLYKKRAKATFNADKRPLNFYNEKMNGCDGDHKKPSSYVNINEVSKFPGPVLLSDDMQIAHRNTVCDPDFKDDIFDYPRSTNMLYLKHAPVTIPPGGVARFEVKVRSPDRDSLSKDVTPFVTTGLVVSTDHGQIMPILVTFEALLGQLKLSRSPAWIEKKRHWQERRGFGHQYSGEVVEVPLQLFQYPIPPPKAPQTTNGITIAPSNELPSRANLTSWMYPFGATSVPLYLSSSFSKEVVLRDMESCNPWFQVALKDADDPASKPQSANRNETAVEIGTLHTTLICPEFQDLLDTYHEVEIPDNNTMFPSFYTCALEWLENRTLLQSYGCGTRPMPRVSMRGDYSLEDDATERALDALNHALTFSMFKYANGRLKYEDKLDEKIVESNRLWEESAGEDIVKSGGSRGSCSVDRLTLDIYSEITDAWRVLSEMDLHSITSNFKATVEYSYSMGKEKTKNDDSKRRSLTVSMRDVAIRTKLSMPKLVEPQELYIYTNKKDEETDFFSVFEFPPILVGDVMELMIPLKNPTGVPVKVKLATVSWEEINRDAEKAREFNTLATDEVRELYLQRFETVFTQTGYDAPIKSPGHSWWEGHGAFYQADDLGQLVQSRHNITIRAGGKAHVSLINPSLYAQSAFMVGCGARCGLRDETNVGNRIETGLRKTSPIGASAAAGASLVGRPRVSTDQDRAFGEDEPTIFAGGTPRVEESPAAYAIPYSGFDEIILPPYGEAEVGPVYFRPPGRNSVMGCEAILDSDAIPYGAKITEACSTAIYQSMVFLENSLTGLERVVLRGKGLWESVVFVDPISSHSLDAFGDLELRNGHTTLVFPGSSVATHHAGSSPHPVIKGVIVQNDGEVDVTFSRIFFVESSKFGAQKREKHRSHHGCSYRGFRLLGCFENEGPTYPNDPDDDSDDDSDEDYDSDDDRTNLFHGFSIPSGSNRTIFVEHFPDCTFQSDFVVLNFEFDTSASHNLHEQTPSHMFVMGDNAQGRRQKQSSAGFRRRNLELMVGFDMSSIQLKNCIPVASPLANAVYVSGVNNISQWNNKTSIEASELEQLERALSLGEALRIHLQGEMGGNYLTSRRVFIGALTFSIGACILLIVTSLLQLRSRVSMAFRGMFRGQRGRAESADRRMPNEASFSQSSWPSTFRCLARADPTSSELQAIGREQVKQIVLHRYKTMGILSPQCIDSTGSFSRDGANQGSRSGVGGGGKIKTLSDSLFHRYNNGDRAAVDSAAIPCGLGWKTAVDRGILSRGGSTGAVRSERVLAKRKGEREMPKKPERSSDTRREGRNEDAAGRAQTINNSSIDSSRARPDSGPGSNQRETKQDEKSKDLSESNQPQTISKPQKEDRVAELDNVTTKRIAVHEDDTKQNISQTSLPVQQKEKNNPQIRGKGRRSANVSRTKSDDASSTESSSLTKTTQPQKPGTAREKEKKQAVSKKVKSNGGQKGRLKTASRRAGEPASPSSMKSISSRSTKTDATVSPVMSPRAVLKIRPPPGLPPPPGFDSIAELDLSVSSLQAPILGDLPSNPQQYSQSSSALLTSIDGSQQPTPLRPDASLASLDQLYLPSTPGDNASSSSLFNTIRATDERNLEISQQSLLHDSLASIDDMLLPSGERKKPQDSSNIPPASSAFDVLGFLDNILEDSGRTENEESSDGAVPSLSSDPWATGGTSRAAAYGISVDHAADDDEGEGIVHAILAVSPHQASESASSTPVVPLLTPDVLSSGGTSVFDDDDDVKQRDDYNSGDFYAKLLGE